MNTPPPDQPIITPDKIIIANIVEAIERINTAIHRNSLSSKSHSQVILDDQLKQIKSKLLSAYTTATHPQQSNNLPF
jgi:hypothetical protein